MVGQSTRDTEEQPAPTEGDGDMWMEVIGDMQERRSEGIRRYGTPLQAYNGRRALVDAYLEQLDLVVYLKQALIERGGMVERLAKERAELYGNADWDKLGLPQRDAWKAEAEAIALKIGL